MTSFSEVFSVTVKVLLALVLVSVIIGGGFLILGLIGTSPAGHSMSAAEAEWDEVIDRDRADFAHQAMPISKWNNAVLRARARHCVFRGMSKDDVLASFGPPTEKNETNDSGKNGSSWTWKWVWHSGDCIRYQGDTCAEYKHEEKWKTIYFTPKGNVETRSDGCEKLKD